MTLWGGSVRCLHSNLEKSVASIRFSSGVLTAPVRECRPISRAMLLMTLWFRSYYTS